MKRQAKRALNESAYDLQEDLEKIKDAFVGASRDVKGRAGEILSDSLDSVKNKSNELQGNVANYAADKPFKALGLAAIIGLAMGYLLRK